MTDPLRISFEVACPVEHAFTVWTSRIGAWWPTDHTVSGEAGLTVVLEAGEGGRIYERTASGQQHEWGRVTRWQPPHQLGYTWHLGRAPGQATQVEISFIDEGDASTRVEIVHRGWEALGTDAGVWRERNQLGWRSLLPHYTAATGGTIDG